MPRKLRLTPLQRDVLWVLEEAGEETLLTIQATLKPPDPEALNAAVAALGRIGYVRQTEEGGRAALALTKEGRQSLTA